MIVIPSVKFVQTADDLRLKTTRIVTNVKIYPIVLLVRLADEYSPALNSQHTVVNVDQSAWFVDEKSLLFIMVVALNLVQ